MNNSKPAGQFYLTKTHTYKGVTFRIYDYVAAGVRSVIRSEHDGTGIYWQTEFGGTMSAHSINFDHWSTKEAAACAIDGAVAEQVAA